MMFVNLFNEGKVNFTIQSDLENKFSDIITGQQSYFLFGIDVIPTKNAIKAKC